MLRAVQGVKSQFPVKQFFPNLAKGSSYIINFPPANLRYNVKKVRLHQCWLCTLPLVLLSRLSSFSFYRNTNYSFHTVPPLVDK